MRVLEFYAIFIITCLLAGAVHHILLTRLERRIGLSGSIFGMLTMDIPSYLRQTICLLIIITSTYLWRDNPLITISIIAVLKISDRGRSFGQAPLNLASLAGMLVSIIFLTTLRSMSEDLVIKGLTWISFLVYLTSAYIFSVKDDGIRPRAIMRLIAINFLGTFSYLNFTNIYILFLMSLIFFTVQIITSWLIPKVNNFKKMQVGVNTTIVSSLGLILVLLFWSLISRGKI